MEVLIVGSVALDDVKTPLGEVRDALGGSAVYSSLAAGYYSRVGIVGVAGEDFPENHRRLLTGRGVRLEGLECAVGRTFHWSGYYEGDMNSAHTLDTQLNVFAEFSPKIPPEFQKTPWVFLANIDPELQLRVLEQVARPKFILLDTMNYWIETKRDALLKVMSQVDMIVVNDAEARQLAGASNLIQAAGWMLKQGVKGVVIKKGEHGALLFWGGEMWAVPAFPLGAVKDPTGAGDTFAGGFIGTLAKLGEITPAALLSAAAVGTVMASFTVEDFSVNRLAGLQEAEIRDRHARLEALTRIGGFPGVKTA